MTTLNNTQIITTINSEYKKTIEQMIAQAKESVNVLKHNLSIKEIGNRDDQVNQAVDYAMTFKDDAILDEVQGNVLRGFISDDQQIEDLEVYDQTCDIRSDFQDNLNEAIDDIVQKIKNMKQGAATDFDYNYHGSVKHSSSNCSEYARHNLDVYNEVMGLSAVYQNGQSYIHGDYSTPSTKMELSSEGGTDSKLIEINQLHADDFEKEEYVKYLHKLIEELAIEDIKTIADLHEAYNDLMVNNSRAEDYAKNLDIEPIFNDIDLD